MDTQLVAKIKKTISKIQRMESTALRYSPKGFVVAFSGGKDSQVVLELAKMAEVRFEAVHSLTTIDPPENVNFIRECYPDVEIVRPALSFSQLVAKKQMMPTSVTRYCCSYLKENYGAGRVVITGVRRDESNKRKDREEVNLRTRRRHPDWTDGNTDEFYRYQETVVHCLQGKDKLVFNPILDWTEDDVWRFIRQAKIPVNPLYQMGCTRVGCVLCPLSSIAAKRFEMLMWPKIADRWFRVFVRDRQRYLVKTGKDKWYELSDTEAFSRYLHRQAPDRSLTLDFED